MSRTVAAKQGLLELFGLDGKVALVTGGASFLGYDMALALADAGATVAVTSRDLEKAVAAAQRLAEATGARTLGLALDVTSEASIELAVREVGSWLGPIDILVNNAGGGVGASAAYLPERETADIRAMIERNLTGPLLVTRAVAAAMIERGAGKIVNIASVAGLLGRDRSLYAESGMAGQPVDYAAAKAGVIGLTRDLAGWLGPHGIQVNAISPGGFGPRQLPERFVEGYGARTPLGRMGRDGVDLKGAVLYLASAASDYVTGHNLVVDGGFSIWR